MLRVYLDLLSILLPRERQRFYLLLCIAAVSAVIEAVAIASILPLLSLLTNPEVILESAVIARLNALAGSPEPRTFQIMLAMAVFGLVVVSVGLKMVTLFGIVRYSQMRVFSLSSRLLQGYLHQPYEFFLTRHSSEIGRNVLYEVEQLVSRVLQPSLLIVSNILVVLFIVLVLFLADPMTATVVALVLLVAYGAIYLSVRKVLSRLGRIVLEVNSSRFRMAQEPLEGVKYVKLRGLEDSYVARFRGSARIMARNGALIQVIQTIPRQFLELLVFGGMLLFIIVRLAQDDGRLEDLVPTIGLIAFAGIRLMPALQTVFQMLAKLRSGQSVLDQIAGDIRQNAAARGTERSATEPVAFAHGIHLTDVTYAYPQSEKPTVAQLTMEIPARATIGIVGGTGAGKTTLVDLLLGLIVPQSGCIQVDGQTIDQALRPSWQKSLGYVPQKIFLTDDSLAANIAFGQPTDAIDMDRVIAAAKTAALHDFVLSDLPQGYDTHLGERGVRLSGGQLQRVGIARALYFDPAVLIFDEATSALDTVTEREVMAAIDTLGGQKTIVMIAHRLSTVRACDRIYLLDKGRVAASGRYEDLVETNETFREMARHA